MTYARRARTGGAVSSRRRLGRPVEYPDDHPYNDPRRRVADALGMREAMRHCVQHMRRLDPRNAWWWM
jgi:hypothetical protein